MREAHTANVQGYLMRVYGLKREHATELLHEHRDILQRGIAFKSHADYVGDEVAKAAEITDLYDEGEWETWEAQWEDVEL